MRFGRRFYLALAVNASVILSDQSDMSDFFAAHVSRRKKISLQTPVSGNVKKVDSQFLSAHAHGEQITRQRMVEKGGAPRAGANNGG